MNINSAMTFKPARVLYSSEISQIKAELKEARSLPG